MSNKPQWEYVNAGTVSFYFNCIGQIASLCNTSVYGGFVSGSVSTGATTITATTVSGLDLTTFPTHIILYNGSVSGEVSICSAAGEVLTVCYDGWGNQSGGLRFANRHVQRIGNHSKQGHRVGDIV